MPFWLERWTWIFISIILAVLSGVARSLLTAVAARESSLKRIARFINHPWIVHPIRLLYAIGLPALALMFQGTLTTRGLGLKPLPTAEGSAWITTWEAWASDLGWAVVIAVGLSVLIRFGDRAIRRESSQPVRLSRRPGVALREAIFHQVHWAFYREPAVVMAGVSAGALLGLLPVFVENLLLPERWADLHDAAAARNLVMRTGLLLASAMFYILTQNLWLSLVLDFCVAWASGLAESETGV